MNNNDKVLIVGIVLAVMVLGFALYSTISKNGSNNTYRIKVDTNGGVPYSWSYKVDDEGLVEVKESSKALNDNEGGPVEVYYDITPVKEGKTTITLEYIDITDQHVEEQQIYEIEIDKDLKMTVKKQK